MTYRWRPQERTQRETRLSGFQRAIDQPLLETHSLRAHFYIYPVLSPVEDVEMSLGASRAVPCRLAIVTVALLSPKAHISLSRKADRCRLPLLVYRSYSLARSGYLKYDVNGCYFGLSNDDSRPTVGVD